MRLRKYQENFIAAISDALTRVRRVVAQLSTGGGKTITFAGICKRYLSQNNPANILPGTGKTIVIAVHRKELLAQTRKSCYNAFRVNAQPVIAGMKHIPKSDVYVCMVETLDRMLRKNTVAELFGDVGILIIDEAHRLEFMKLHPHFPESYIIGFTATPVTSSKKKPMKMYYDGIVTGVDIDWLINHNRKFPEEGLCQNITYAPKDTVDRSELAQHMIGGEFNDKFMAQQYSKVQHINNTVKAYQKYAPRTKALVFNVNVFHSKAVTEAFVTAGYDCKHIDGEMPTAEREALLHWFENTPGSILCNVGIGTTGLDIPSIQTIIVNKSTASLSLWLQMCGRGSRPTLQKSFFTIIDMGGNGLTSAHSDWCLPRDWKYIFHNPERASNKESVAPTKICPKCDGLIPAGVRVCGLFLPDTDPPELCGHEFDSGTIPTEVDLHEFIVITKNIDVAEIIESNRQKNEHYPVYAIGEELIRKCRDTVDTMTDAYAEFILGTYYDLIRQMCKQKGKRFDEYHRKMCKAFLYEKLQQNYDWIPGVETVPMHVTPPHAVVRPAAISFTPPPAPDWVTMPVIQNLETIKSIHYD